MILVDSSVWIDYFKGTITAQTELLDRLPMLGDILTDAPLSLQARLFAAVGLEMIYNKEDHQVSIYATITPSTPTTLAAIIAGSEPPTTPAPDGLALSSQHPRM